jgi:anti-sigma regulatory factor (Ser/Thr protein kinase)
MRELSLNVLDIAQNSISAGASLITLLVDEDTAENRLTLTIADNGRGMTPEQLEQVRDPFYTTRTTRKVGMGIPLFRMAAEMASGDLTIQSQIGVGTTVTAKFELRHIDRMPLGDMNGTVSTLIRLNPELDFLYRYTVDGTVYELDTRELRVVLDGVSLSEPDVMTWIDAHMEEGILPLNPQA